MTEETTFRKLKKALLELLDGYPDYAFHGKIEFFLPKTGGQSVDLLINHDIIEELPKKDVEKLNVDEDKKKYRWYRLRPRGVDLTISMINLEHSEKVLDYSNKTNRFTGDILAITILLAMISLGQFLLVWLQLRALG